MANTKSQLYILHCSLCYLILALTTIHGASVREKRAVTLRDILNPDLPEDAITDCVTTQKANDAPLSSIQDTIISIQQEEPAWQPQGMTLDQYENCGGLSLEECQEVAIKKQEIDRLMAELAGTNSLIESPVDFIEPKRSNDQGSGESIGVLERGSPCEEIIRARELDRILESLRSRVKRKIRNFQDFPNEKWDTTINFGIDVGFSARSTAKIVAAFRYWEENTCLRFQRTKPSLLSTPSIIVRKNYAGKCSSAVGRQSELKNPQPISLAEPGCLVTMGSTAHELGHALGLYHQHQQPDRDDYILVKEENVVLSGQSFLLNFGKNPEGNDVKGQPYDLGSIMQYGPYAFSKNKKTTIEPLDLAAKQLANMGQSTKPSFIDIQTINDVYCADVCKGQPSPVCMNDGYQDPNNCAKCKCHVGLGGDSCERYQGSEGCAPLSGEVNLRGKQVECFQTPNFVYHNGTSYCWGHYSWNDTCRWKIMAPGGCQIKLWFPYSHGYLLGFGDGTCVNWLELKYLGERHQPNGHRICLETWKTGYKEDSPLITPSNTLMAEFEGYDAKSGVPRAFRPGKRFCVQIDDTSSKCNPMDFDVKIKNMDDTTPTAPSYGKMSYTSRVFKSCPARMIRNRK